MKTRLRRHRRKAGPVLASLIAHGLVLAVIWAAPVERPSPEAPVPSSVEVMLVDPPPPPPPPPPSAPAPGDAPAGGSEPAPRPEPEPAPEPAAPVPAETPEKARRAAPTPPTPRPSRPTPRQTQVEPLPITASEPSVSFVLLGDGALGGALTAGQGAGGGGGSGGGSGSGVGGGSGQGCDMVKRLQDVLRNDARIVAAVGQAYRTSGASGRAILMWNGDWLRSPGEEGKGLAGVRQAIAVTVGFSSRACKAETVDGYVLLTLSDQPGAPRVALGGGRWRWSDLLSL
ncbi:MAG: hypothetical protein J0I52_07845 [Bordetella sp.]|nr:hypothetical protein [Bordetella sp.]